MSGECRLLWAVLEDGIECYLRYADHPSAVMRELFQEAKDWIEATGGEDLCSFSGICGAFQIDPSLSPASVTGPPRAPDAGPLKRAA